MLVEWWKFDMTTCNILAIADYDKVNVFIVLQKLVKCREHQALTPVTRFFTLNLSQLFCVVIPEVCHALVHCWVFIVAKPALSTGHTADWWRLVHHGDSYAVSLTIFLLYACAVAFVLADITLSLVFDYTDPLFEASVTCTAYIKNYLTICKASDSTSWTLRAFGGRTTNELVSSSSNSNYTGEFGFAICDVWVIRAVGKWELTDSSHWPFNAGASAADWLADLDVLGPPMGPSPISSEMSWELRERSMVVLRSEMHWLQDCSWQNN